MQIEISESELQALAEKYLCLRGVRFVHIPSKIQVFIWSGICPIWVGRLASKYLKGIPDLLIFGDSENEIRRCLVIELKSKNGTLTTEQKQWNPKVCRTFDEFKSVVDYFVCSHKRA